MYKKILSILLAVLLLAAFAGCAGEAPPASAPLEAASGEAPSSGGTAASARNDMKVGMATEPVTLDPHNTFDPTSLMAISNVFDSLLVVDKTGEEVMRLATGYTLSDDGLTYTINLQEGVTFQSGRPFNAASLKANMERARETPYWVSRLEMYTECNIIDDYTVEIKLSEPFSPFIRCVGTLCIADIDALNEMGEEAFGRSPVGTGPYQVSEWVSGDKLVLEAFPDYFMGAAPIQQLEMRIIPDSSSMLIALENGEIDVGLDFASIDLASIEANDALSLYTVPTTLVESLIENCEKEPFNDARVRRALAMCVDKQAIIDVAFNGHANIADQPITPAYIGYVQDYVPVERDIEGAKALLAEAGYPDGFTTTISASEGFRKQAAEIIQTNLADIGITAEIELLEFGTMLDKGAEGDFDLMILDLGSIMLETYYMMLYNYSTDLWGASGNFARQGNAELDAMISEYGAAVSAEEKDELVKKMVQLIDEEGYAVPLYYRDSNVGANAELKGVAANHIGFVRFWDFSW